MRKRLKTTLSEALPSQDFTAIYSSFDVIGEIAIFKTPHNSSVNPSDIAAAIMKCHKNVKAVFAQETEVKGNFRLRGLMHVAGDDRTITVHREFGCTFKVDVAKCYFSPRLLGERARITKLVQPGETVINMFAGVGCFSIPIAKYVNEAKIFSIDINPDAVAFMTENVRINRVYGNVFPILGDARTVIRERLRGSADRVLMPLPEKALEYLPDAVSALKPGGGWIHVHTFEHAPKGENLRDKTQNAISIVLSGLDADFEVVEGRVVRSTGPNWWHLVTDVRIYK